jgi:hypothetical protein
MEAIIAQIMAIVGPALITAIGIIVTWGLNELRRWAKEHTNNQAVDAAFTSLNKISTSAVIRAEQAMKEFGADGKITPSEAVKIKRMVFQDIKNQLPKATEKTLGKVANNLDDLVDSKIEETVYLLKAKYGKK